jgi:alkyl sulfatase BDS1-like metallo-beta-lactamase superfamily hydrolase
MNKIQLSMLVAVLALHAGCGRNSGVGGAADEATSATQKANEQIAQEFKLDDPKDFEDAKRGLRDTTTFRTSPNPISAIAFAYKTYSSEVP